MPIQIKEMSNVTHRRQIASLRPALAVAALAASALMPAAATAGLADWGGQVGAGTPATFSATNIFTPSVVDIGALTGDITYEFIVNGKDRAAAGSLIGSLANGQNQAIRFEQWQNTGAYGATLYGIDDYSFGVATAFDIDVDLAFVVDSAAGTTALFVNGIDTGTTVPFALTLQGPVGFGGTLLPGGSFLGDDAYEGVILGFAAYDSALSAPELKAHADAFFVTEPATWTMLLGAGFLGAGLLALARLRKVPHDGQQGGCPPLLREGAGWTKIPL